MVLSEITHSGVALGLDIMRNSDLWQRIGASIFGLGILFGVLAFSPAIFGNQAISGLWLLSMLSGVGLGIMAFGFRQSARRRSQLIASQRSQHERN
ncbi:MAG: hypothetical protein RIS09_143 [Actinomycetota bacterium]